MGACSSACKSKAGASAPAVQPEAKADAAAESTMMQPFEAACDKSEGAKGIVGIAAEATGEKPSHAGEVASDVTPVLESLDATTICCLCCSSATVVQLEAKADAAVESDMMQSVEAASDQAEDAKRVVKSATEALGETPGLAEEIAADVAPVLEGAEVGKNCGWCCATASAVQPEAKADAAAESTMMQPVDAAQVKTEDAKMVVEVAA